ncbi:MAG: hypothetical protein ACXWQR_19355 [Ktedonobacterales bacterium]
MLDLWDWLDGRMRAGLVLVLLLIVCAAGTMGYIASRTLHPIQVNAAATMTATPTTSPDLVLLWAGSSEAKDGPLSPDLSITDRQAKQGVSLLWRCLPTPDGMDTSFSINIRQGNNRYAWVGNAIQCGGSGSNYINTLHGGTFQVEINAKGPWTVRVLARKP